MFLPRRDIAFCGSLVKLTQDKPSDPKNRKYNLDYDDV